MSSLGTSTAQFIRQYHYHVYEILKHNSPPYEISEAYYNLNYSTRLSYVLNLCRTTTSTCLLCVVHSTAVFNVFSVAWLRSRQELVFVRPALLSLLASYKIYSANYLMWVHLNRESKESVLLFGKLFPAVQLYFGSVSVSLFRFLGAIHFLKNSLFNLRSFKFCSHIVSIPYIMTGLIIVLQWWTIALLEMFFVPYSS